MQNGECRMQSSGAASQPQKSGGIAHRAATKTNQHKETKAAKEGGGEDRGATAAEWEALRCQIGTLKIGRGRHRKYLPWVFTEHGALMAASILNSERAVAMSVYVV